MWHRHLAKPLVASLLLVAMRFVIAPSSFLFLVVVWTGAPSSFLLLVAKHASALRRPAALLCCAGPISTGQSPCFEHQRQTSEFHQPSTAFSINRGCCRRSKSSLTCNGRGLGRRIHTDGRRGAFGAGLAISFRNVH